MERSDFVTILSPLVVAMRAEFDNPTWTVYFRALEDVPDVLLQAAVERATKSAKFMPKPSELREFAEDARKALLGSVKYLPCAQCDESGWETVLIDGVSRVQRCGCWLRHQQKVAQLGVGSVPLALPAGVAQE